MQHTRPPTRQYFGFWTESQPTKRPRCRPANRSHIGAPSGSTRRSNQHGFRTHRRASPEPCFRTQTDDGATASPLTRSDHHSQSGEPGHTSPTGIENETPTPTPNQQQTSQSPSHPTSERTDQRARSAPFVFTPTATGRLENLIDEFNAATPDPNAGPDGQQPSTTTDSVDASASATGTHPPIVPDATVDFGTVPSLDSESD